MGTIAGVVFDMDGVLVDTEPIYTRVLQDYMRELGFEISAREIEEFVGIPSIEMWKILMARYPITVPMDTLLEEGRMRSRGALASEPLFPIPGIPELLDEIGRRSFPVAVASSSSRVVIDLVLGRSGLLDRFPQRIGRQDVDHPKPHPEPYHKAAVLLGLTADRILVVEDSPHGVAAARAAGARCVGFLNPGSGTQDLSAAHLRVPDIGDSSRARILELIDR